MMVYVHTKGGGSNCNIYVVLVQLLHNPQNDFLKSGKIKSG